MIPFLYLHFDNVKLTLSQNVHERPPHIFTRYLFFMFLFEARQVSLVDSPSSSLNKIPAPNFSFKAFKVKPALSRRISTLMLESMDLLRNWWFKACMMYSFAVFSGQWSMNEPQAPSHLHTTSFIHWRGSDQCQWSDKSPRLKAHFVCLVDR